LQITRVQFPTLRRATRLIRDWGDAIVDDSRTDPSSRQAPPITPQEIFCPMRAQSRTMAHRVAYTVALQCPTSRCRSRPTRAGTSAIPRSDGRTSCCPSRAPTSRSRRRGRCASKAAIGACPVAKRYGSRARYQALVTDRVGKLVEEGYLLREVLDAVGWRRRSRVGTTSRRTRRSRKRRPLVSTGALYARAHRFNNLAP
jgi:hypothetical protein